MTEVERQLNRKVKIIRSDRGGECYGRTTKISQLHGPFAKYLESMAFMLNILCQVRLSRMMLLRDETEFSWK